MQIPSIAAWRRAAPSRLALWSSRRYPIREKNSGDLILALAPEGLSLSGAELASFEDLAVMIRDGEPFTPAVVFFPMHRIERVELDLPEGSLPSLSQRFLAKTGLEPFAALTPSATESERGQDASSDGGQA